MPHDVARAPQTDVGVAIRVAVSLEHGSRARDNLRCVRHQHDAARSAGAVRFVVAWEAEVRQVLRPQEQALTVDDDGLGVQERVSVADTERVRTDQEEAPPVAGGVQLLAGP